jgi:hypothetical protein
VFVRPPLFPTISSLSSASVSACTRKTFTQASNAKSGLSTAQSLSRIFFELFVAIRLVEKNESRSAVSGTLQFPEIPSCAQLQGRVSRHAPLFRIEAWDATRSIESLRSCLGSRKLKRKILWILLHGTCARLKIHLWHGVQPPDSYKISTLRRNRFSGSSAICSPTPSSAMIA